MNINSTNNWNDKLDEMIVIGGSARSGTTMIGKIIHSMKGVEYFYEPPLLTSILMKEDELTIESLREILGFYLYDSLFLDSLAGRNVNLNKNDDSCIYNVKEINEIQDRFKKSFSRIELEEVSKRSTLSFKLPEIVFFLETLKKISPCSKLVLMHRNANDVISSIVKKRWFSNEFIKESHNNQVYAVKIINGIKIPFWVQEKDVEFWLNADEINKCAYYCLKISESIINNSDNAIIVDYNFFIVDPVEKTEYLAEKLGLIFTDKTRKILSTVKCQNKEKWEWGGKINKNLANQIEVANLNIIKLSI